MANPPPIDSADPPTGPLITGERIGRGPTYRANRPKGRSDWLAIYTITGAGRFTYEGVDIPLGRGDVLVVRPGAPQDYGTIGPQFLWHNLWVHFIPRGDMLSWLDWPSIAPGVMRLPLPRELQGRVLSQFREMDAFSQKVAMHRQELALNALERALLLADTANPQSAMGGYDPRVRQAVQYLMANLNDPPSLTSLAELVHLSRSRFARLFEQQVGQPPGKFIEQHRLFRVKQLLEHTRDNLKEIAEEMGYSSPFYLSLRFKACFGVSPQGYRKRLGVADARR
jgi:AraC family transcriptional regulator, arabinose operon regulatory protein